MGEMFSTKIVAKPPGFSDEMVHIRDNCFVFIDNQFIDIVLEHEDSLECHGFSRCAINKCTMKNIIEQPVLKAVDDTLVGIMSETVINRTVKEASSCKELRSICKRWKNNHYVHKVYDGRYDSIYAFVYSVANMSPIIFLQCVNYGSMSISGSFAVERDIVEKIYNLI